MIVATSVFIMPLSFYHMPQDDLGRQASKQTFEDCALHEYTRLEFVGFSFESSQRKHQPYVRKQHWDYTGLANHQHHDGVDTFRAWMGIDVWSSVKATKNSCRALQTFTNLITRAVLKAFSVVCFLQAMFESLHRFKKYEFSKPDTSADDEDKDEDLPERESTKTR